MVENRFGDGGGVLEITLDAGPDADDDAREPQHINHEYVQNTIKGIKRSFTIFDDIYLNYSLNTCNPKAFKLNFFKSKDFEHERINLTYLDPKPDRLVHMAWEWFVTGLAAIAWAFVIIYVGEYTDFLFSHDIMLPVGILLGTFGVIAFLLFYYKCQDKVLYTSYVGQAPVFDLIHMPRNKAYNEFIDLLEKSIYEAHRKRGITMKHRLAGELKHLRRMNESGLITEVEYENARSKILRHEGHNV